MSARQVTNATYPACTVQIDVRGYVIAAETKDTQTASVPTGEVYISRQLYYTLCIIYLSTVVGIYACTEMHCMECLNECLLPYNTYIYVHHTLNRSKSCLKR